jgi:hypothetical protein
VGERGVCRLDCSSGVSQHSIMPIQIAVIIGFSDASPSGWLASI